MRIALGVLLAYLIGAFPAALVYGRLFRSVDVRRHGSGNAGGTNAWRVLGWRIGLPVILTDVGKGAVAAAVIPRVLESPLDLTLFALLCGIAAVLGHVFPIYTRFRGGKGVAAGAGVLLAVAPLPALIALAVFAVVIITSGIVSLGSILAALSLPVSAVLLDRFTQAQFSWSIIGVCACLAIFVVFTHRTNLVRLLRREEGRFVKLQIWRRLRRDA